jgi:hypothetical protein
MEPENGGAGPSDGGPDSIPPATINSLICTSPGAGSLALQWVAPGDDDETGTAAEYDIRYSKSSLDESSWDAADKFADAPAPAEAGEIQICRVIGLDSKTQYYFGVKTKDEAENESGLSNIADGITRPELIAPANISDLVAVAVDDSTFLLTWTAPGDDGAAFGTASTYDIRYNNSQAVTGSNWQNASQVVGEPAPKSAGEPESLLVVIDHHGDNHGFAIKTADEVPNWSGVSNSSLALGINEFLWAYPATISRGQNMSILYRSTGTGELRLEMHPGYAGYDCGSHRYTLYAGQPDAGVYTLLYDFSRSNGQIYLDEDWYFLYVCINAQNRGSYRVRFINP